MAPSRKCHGFHLMLGKQSQFYCAQSQFFRASSSWRFRERNRTVRLECRSHPFDVNQECRTINSKYGNNEMNTTISYCRRFARIAPAIVLLAISACEDKCCRLQVHATPPVSENNTALAGLEVEVDGHTFRPKDFAMIANDTRWAVSTSVAKHGNQQVFVRIIDDGRIVAKGSISWMLNPVENWVLRIARQSPADFSGLCLSGYETFAVGEPVEGEQAGTVHLCLQSYPADPEPGVLYN